VTVRTQTHSAHGTIRTRSYSWLPKKPLVGVVYGRVAEFEPVNTVVCKSIGVHPDHRGEGLGRRLLTRFEDRAHDLVERVSVAAANDVGRFYERCGYEVSRLLLQLGPDRSADLPEPRDDDRYRRERLVDNTRFVYFDHDGDSTVCQQTAERYDVHVNTIYDKHL